MGIIIEQNFIDDLHFQIEHNNYVYLLRWNKFGQNDSEYFDTFVEFVFVNSSISAFQLRS